MRLDMEDLFYTYGVDFVLQGHVHAYERTYPVYNNKLNPCGSVYLNLGDGGNYEGPYASWRQPADVWSAFREGSFGIGELEIFSESAAKYQWHRTACGSSNTSAPVYGMDFSDNCVSPGDNSLHFETVDVVMYTKPLMSECPNRYYTAPGKASKSLRG